MKVLELKTKKIISVNDSYGARLIEHGLAILPPISPTPVKDSTPASKAEKAAKKGDA